jgi:hypothetical protein
MCGRPSQDLKEQVEHEDNWTINWLTVTYHFLLLKYWFNFLLFIIGFVVPDLSSLKEKIHNTSIQYCRKLVPVSDIAPNLMGPLEKRHSSESPVLNYQICIDMLMYLWPEHLLASLYWVSQSLSTFQWSLDIHLLWPDKATELLTVCIY